jgi:hypothetical protein
VPQDEQASQPLSEMFVTALKNVSARFRKDAPAIVEGSDQAL